MNGPASPPSVRWNSFGPTSKVAEQAKSAAIADSAQQAPQAARAAPDPATSPAAAGRDLQRADAQ
eukprot:5121042-Alexandrium_andersonii.AAC.1